MDFANRESLNIEWDTYEIEGDRRYLYVPGRSDMPTYDLVAMRIIARQYQARLQAAEAELAATKRLLAAAQEANGV